MNPKNFNLDNPEDFEKYEKNFDFSSVKFNFQLSKANYQLDSIQNQLLQLYMAGDSKFRRAFHTNFTPSFLDYIKSKTKLNEPLKLSCLGATRSGKSFSMMTICILHQLYYKQLFHPFYICANVFEYIDKLQKTPSEKLFNRIFLVDEEKSTFGVGSIARKMKVEDTQHIIAINNISTIMLTPVGWQDKNADYGIRTFGRCFDTKTCRLMLYNLQEKGSGGSLPMGCLYLPIFTKFMENEYGQWLEKKYLDKKNEWVDRERMGEGDVLETLKKKTAISFTHDPKYMNLKTKRDRINYITLKLGSEWTSGEKEIIEGYTKLLKDGVINEEEIEDEGD